MMVMGSSREKYADYRKTKKLNCDTKDASLLNTLPRETLQKATRARWRQDRPAQHAKILI